MENRILLLSGLSLKQSESLCSSYTPVDFVLSLVNRSQMCSSWQDGKHQTHQILWSVRVQKSSEVSVDNSALSCCPCGGVVPDFWAGSRAEFVSVGLEMGKAEGGGSLNY